MYKNRQQPARANTLNNMTCPLTLPVRRIATLSIRKSTPALLTKNLQTHCKKLKRYQKNFGIGREFNLPNYIITTFATA